MCYMCVFGLTFFSLFQLLERMAAQMAFAKIVQFKISSTHSQPLKRSLWLTLLFNWMNYARKVTLCRYIGKLGHCENLSNEQTKENNLKSWRSQFSFGRKTQSQTEPKQTHRERKSAREEAREWKLSEQSKCARLTSFTQSNINRRAQQGSKRKRIIINKKKKEELSAFFAFRAATNIILLWIRSLSTSSWIIFPLFEISQFFFPSCAHLLWIIE